MEDYRKKAERWLSSTFDEETQQAVQKLVDEDSEALQESFYQDLKFGTGGMRGIMGVGTNRVNKYTLGRNTQGLSNYLKKNFPERDIQVAIAFDCRHNSKELAQLVADVFSANGIRVYLFSDLRPTPELSFAVRKLECQSGIVLTASHNPPEYNGYKVYWSDGGQLVPPHDEAVADEISKLDFSDISFTPNPDLITKIDQEIDEAFIENSTHAVSFGTSEEAKQNLTIAYTALHGTSITLIPDVLEKAGFTRVNSVAEQAEPNGDFPTVESPNPEEPAALKMVLDLADKTQADIAVGTDPDADRLGIAVRDLEGEMTLLNGNQTMVLLTDFLLKKWKEKGFNGSEFIGSTIVSSPLMDALAEAYGIECKWVLTGFKWIADLIRRNPDQKFIGGGEESFGYMVSDFVRDKDSVTSVLLACTMAAEAKAEGKTLYEKLIDLYLEHGLYQERVVALVKKGLSGAAEIKKMIGNLRDQPPKTIGGQKVVALDDYQLSKHTDLTTSKETKITLPKSNVLVFYLENGSRIATRPSGTEPKIKFYVSTRKELASKEDFANTQKELNQNIDDLLATFGI